LSLQQLQTAKTKFIASLEQHQLQNARESMSQIFALAKNCGGVRAFVACSKAYANRMSTASDHARPKNDIPTGKPKTNPAGTVMLG